jgi:hypothetical protein
VTTGWSFLTNHARALLSIANDPGIRLREIAAALGITERRAYGIVADLANAGYVVKQRDGRRNLYEVQHHLPLREAGSRERTIGEVLNLLVGPSTPNGRRNGSQVAGSSGARSVPAGRTRGARSPSAPTTKNSQRRASKPTARAATPPRAPRKDHP